MVDDASGDRDATDATDGSADSTRDDAQWGSSSSWDASSGWADSDDERADSDRIPLDLSGDSDAAGTDDSAEDADADTDEDDPYAPEPSSTPIEAGEPDVENAVFVVLGAVAMILVLLRVVSLPF